MNTYTEKMNEVTDMLSRVIATQDEIMLRLDLIEAMIQKPIPAFDAFRGAEHEVVPYEHEGRLAREDLADEMGSPTVINLNSPETFTDKEVLQSPDWVLGVEAAAILGVSETNVLTYCRANKVRVYKPVFKRNHVYKPDLIKLADARKTLGLKRIDR